MLRALTVLIALACLLTVKHSHTVVDSVPYIDAEWEQIERR